MRETLLFCSRALQRALSTRELEGAMFQRFCTTAHMPCAERERRAVRGESHASLLSPGALFANFPKVCWV